MLILQNRICAMRQTTFSLQQCFDAIKENKQRSKSYLLSEALIDTENVVRDLDERLADKNSFL